MTGQVAGAIKTDRKPRTRKTLADRAATLRKQIDKADKAMDRAILKRDTLIRRLDALLAEAKAVTEGAQP